MADYENIGNPYDRNLTRKPDQLDVQIGGGSADQSVTQQQSAALANLSQPGGNTAASSSAAGGPAQQASVGSGGAMADVVITNTIQSANWQPKKVGFYINGQTGYAEFSNVFVTGEIDATTGQIGGWVIGADELSKGNVHLKSTAEQIILGTLTGFDNGTGLFLGKDGSSYKFSVGKQNGSKLTFDGTNTTATNVDIVSKYTVGEDLVFGNAVFVAAEEETQEVLINGGGFTILGGTGSSAVKEDFTLAANWYAQSFTTSANCRNIQACFIALGNVEASDTITVRLRTNLTGSSIISRTFNLTSLSPTDTETYRLYFDDLGEGIAVDPSTTYYWVVSYVNAGGANTPNIAGSATTSYPDGSAWASTDSGATWAAATTVADFVLLNQESYTDTGRVYKTIASGYINSSQARVSDNRMNGFIGFCRDTTAAKGTLANIQIAGVFRNFATMIPGYSWYLSNTVAGALQTTAPTLSYKAGVGTSGGFVGLTTSVQTSVETCDDTHWCAQSFTTSSLATTLASVQVGIKNTEAGDTIHFMIRSALTGSDLYSTSTVLSGTNSVVQWIQFLNIGLTVSPNTLYYALVYIINAGGALTPVLTGNSVSTYASGAAYTSSNSGSTWGTAATVADFYTIWQEDPPGLLMFQN